ncbi:hypothetical protein B0J14DRAFT_645829 [Halenospora varia]|nr:hypothetical protein B0J14DRAFT_645829 [Halenospora varia]
MDFWLPVRKSSVAPPAWPKGLKLNNPYTGDFKTKIKGQIVFVSNTADAKQSLENAKKIASRFSNSRVITVNEFGSSSFFSGFSVCVDRLRGPWWNNGVLPSVSLFCNDATVGAFGVGYVADYR